MLQLSYVKYKNFNSIKVRLKLQNQQFDFNYKSSFQFHKGTIKTCCRLGNIVTHLYFNSIKVRLKRAAPQYVAKYVKFQFHKGTIKTG